MVKIQARGMGLWTPSARQRLFKLSQPLTLVGSALRFTRFHLRALAPFVLYDELTSFDFGALAIHVLLRIPTRCTLGREFGHKSAILRTNELKHNLSVRMVASILLP